MAAHFGTLELVTNHKAQMLDVTKRVRAEVKSSGIENGICVVASTHTTGGVTLNENTDPDVQTDILNALDRAVPSNATYYKHEEGNAGGKLLLGTWQAIFFCEFDGPRTRKLNVAIVG